MDLAGHLELLLLMKVIKCSSMELTSLSILVNNKLLTVLLKVLMIITDVMEDMLHEL